MINQLKALFDAKSNLTSHERRDFLEILSHFHEIHLGRLLSLFTQRPEWIGAAFGNYKKKKMLALTDIAGWEKMIAEEKKILENLPYSMHLSDSESDYA
ncbi:MAG: hypothetical protein V4665_01990 [Patescibacteria group bacterium]